MQISRNWIPELLRMKLKIRLVFLLLALLTLISTAVVLPWQDRLTPAQAAEQIAVSCQTHLNQDCLARQFSTITSQRRIDFAFAALAEIQKTDGPARDCHFIAHSIAAAEVKADPDNWQTVLNKLCPTSCSYGCSHGVLEEYAALQGRDLSDEDLLSACNEDSPPSCPHGIGHLLLVQTGNRIDESIAQCHKLKNRGETIFQCVSGVFMENSTPVNLIQHGLVAPPMPKSVSRIPELEETCRGYRGIDAVACWQELAPPVLQQGGFKPDTIKYCDGLPDRYSTRVCQIRMVDTYAWNQNYNVLASAQVCTAQAGNGFADLCSTMVAQSIMDNLPSAAPDLARYCLTLGLNQKSDCFKVIGNNFRNKPDLGQELWDSACSQVTEDLNKICRAGGDVSYRELPPL